MKLFTTIALLALLRVPYTPPPRDPFLTDTPPIVNSNGGYAPTTGGASILPVGTVFKSPFSKYEMVIGYNGTATFFVNPDFKG